MNSGSTFHIAGIEPRVLVDGRTGPLHHTLQVGMRGHWERAYDQRVDGDDKDARDGTMRNEELRVGTAFAAYVHDQIGLADDALQISPGLRLEVLSTTRTITTQSNELLDPPVVATDMPTHTQTLDPEIAVLAAPEPEAFAAGMTALIDDPERCRRLAQAARERADELFSDAAYLAQVAAFYEQVTTR